MGQSCWTSRLAKCSQRVGKVLQGAYLGRFMHGEGKGKVQEEGGGVNNRRYLRLQTCCEANE